MMSHRGKRQALSRSDDITPVATKRRKGRASATTEEEEAPSLEQQRASYSDIKMSSIYNRSVTEAPAELFRKDLISAMKLPDSEPLTSEKYWVITDQWKQEWERGVQVPVKPDSLPGPVVSTASSRVNAARKMHHEYKLPKNKYIRITKDEHFRVDEHYLSNVGIQAEKCCAYDLEDVDVVWLNILNGERALLGLKTINQDQLERVIEELEMRCWEKVHAIVKKEEGLALEFDESVICDVCRSPDSEEGNEMVFCDCCNICVHQACYGITSIPSGSWLCRTCVLGLRPECVLCPNKNGAMKSTRTGQKWAHVSCALWIPEVSIGCVEKMEPITKISSIPQSRWALICVLCRERVGACIQCSVKTCKTAYHVTCAFKHGLEMRAIIDEDSATDDDNTVKLRSYCQKHSVNSKKESISAPTGSDEEVKKVHRKDMTTEEKTHARAVKLQEIEAEFEKHVNVKDITRKYDVDAEGLEYIYNYWVLKRRASFNKPLLAAKSDDASDLQNKNQEAVDQEKMRMFVQLRQDLERVRNLCYMVSRREKLSRTYQKLREQTFYKQAAILSDSKAGLSTTEVTAIKDANHGPSIYDRLYSYPNAPDLSTDFETMVHRIAGQSDPELSPRHAVNGFIFSSKKDRKRFNGDICKDSSLYESLSSSTSDIDSKSHVGVETESDAHGKVNNRMNKSQRKNNVENRIKNTARRRKKTSPASYLGSTTSSEPEDGVDVNTSSKVAQRSKKNSSSSKKQSSVTRPFGLLERLGSRSDSISTGDDDTEDDLFMLRKQPKSESKKSDISKIYTSDSDSSGKDLSSSASRKQVRTKASVKEFTGSGGTNRSSKDSGRSNSVSKSTAFSLTKGSAAADKNKKRVNDLFNEESEESKMSASENDVFVSHKAAKIGNEVVSKNKKLKSDSVKGEKEKKSPLHEKKVRKELMEDNFLNDCTNRDSANYLDTLTLVPQRAAAKKAIKAIEHIKNGMVKPVTNFDEVEMDAFKSNLKSSKTSKKEQQHSSTLKHKSADGKESKPDVKSAMIDKRIPPKSSSSVSSSFTPSHSSSVPASAATVTSSATTSSSGSSNATSSVLTATAAKLATASNSSKNASSSSSGSSSGSSSSGSSSSSSSSSSSDSSSSGSSSSSSSSESEAEDAPGNLMKKKLPNSKAAPETANDKKISVSVPTHKPMPECKKRELDLKNAKNNHVVSANEISVTDKEETKPQVTSETVNVVEKPESPPVVGKQPEIADYPIIDKSAILETKTAIEHLTSGEQSFMLPSAYWDSTNNEKDENKIENHADDDKKCRNRSLFSPMKDFDLSPFDDDMNENNNLTEGSFSLASLSLFSADVAYKEDTKEDSVRETLNLVEKLKLQMARNNSNHTNENPDSGVTPNSPDLSANHMITEDDNKDESIDNKADSDTVKSDESTASESSQHAHSTSNIDMMIPTDDHTAANASIPVEPHPPVDIFNSSSFPADIAHTKLDPPTNKEPIGMNGPQTHNSNWPPQSGQRYEESSSPYPHDLAHPADRWSESVMMPSRRSDCSSASHSSSSSSSSTYSEHHHVNEMMSNPEDGSRVDSVPTLEMQHKSVTDLLQPPRNNSSIPENMYAYSNFNSTAPMADKTMFPHAPQQVNQPSSLFSTPMFDPMSAYTNTEQLTSKPYGQPLSIQTPCAATASFTTTSQNMAMITSIISPMPPPTSEEVPATPVIGGGSANFKEKIPEMVAEPTPVTAENVQAQLQPPPKPKEVYSGVEKENNLQLPTNLDDVNATQVEAVRPLTEKNDNENETDSQKVSEESASVTNLFSNDSSTATTPVATLQPKTLQMTISKKSPVKPLRVSARVMSQNKSPVAKSPVSAGVSPARPETVPTTAKGKSREGGSRKNNRSNKTAANRRGRGRGRGRNQFSNCFHRDWEGDTITDKLVGTVYDFDDDAEAPSDNFENLRAMRERRKSTDTPYCDRLSTSSKDTCYSSPKFASPSPQLQNSKRKGSVASTPDRRSSHRTPLSPLCEIGNNSRVIQKDLYHDSLAPAEDDEDEEEEEEEDDQGEDEEEDEDVAFTSSEKKSTAVCGKNDRNASSASPTLPQPPVQSSSDEHLAAVQPVLPGPVDMRTYSGSVYDTTSSPASNRANITNTDNLLKSTFPMTAAAASCAEPVPDIVDALEKEIEKYSSFPFTISRSQKSSPAVASPRVCNDAAKLDETDTHNRSSPNNFAVDEHAEHVPSESSVVLIDDEITMPPRNQLKFKIKGPYSDANYASSSISAVQLPSASNSIPGISATDGFPSAASFANTSVSSASSSNLRRMRKKELLEQYKAQGVLDESGNDIATVLPNSGLACEPHSGTTSNLPVKSGPTYKLPKAVASMTTIPTKEDYKAVLETAAYIEKKKRGKDKSSVCLDASDISNNNINNSNYGNHNTYNNKQQPNNLLARSPDRKSFSGAVAQEFLNDNHGSRRRSRNITSSSSAPPKLKIKIGSGAASSVVLDNSVCSVTSSEEKNLRLRPPKKRLCDQTDMQPLAPAVEQLKLECLRYRNQVISEFNENGETGAYEDFSDSKNRRGNTTTMPSSKHSDVPSKKRKKRSTSKSSKRKRKQQRAIEAAEDEESRNGPLVRVISVDSGAAGAPKKLIIKFGRMNQASEPPVEKSSKSSKRNASLETPSAPSPSPQPIPTKPPKSSKRNMNNELDSVRTDKITPIRLKIKRSKEGYVSKSEVAVDNVPAEKAAPADLLPEAPVAAKTTATTPVDEAAPPAAASSTEAQVSAVSTS